MDVKEFINKIGLNSLSPFYVLFMVIPTSKWPHIHRGNDSAIAYLAFHTKVGSKNSHVVLTNLHQNPSVPNYILLASAGKRNKEKLLTVSDIYDFGCFWEAPNSFVLTSISCIQKARWFYFWNALSIITRGVEKKTKNNRVEVFFCLLAHGAVWWGNKSRWIDWKHGCVGCFSHSNCSNCHWCCCRVRSLPKTLANTNVTLDSICNETDYKESSKSSLEPVGNQIKVIIYFKGSVNVTISEFFGSIIIAV